MSERNLEIDSGWLVERDPNGGDFHEGHMLPGSDCTPLVDLSTLPGWMVFSEEAIERAAEAVEASGILPSNGNDQQDRNAATGIVRAVVAALRGEE